MFGSIAQLGEHMPYKHGVTGSSPVVPTKLALRQEIKVKREKRKKHGDCPRVSCPRVSFHRGEILGVILGVILC